MEVVEPNAFEMVERRAYELRKKERNEHAKLEKTDLIEVGDLVLWLPDRETRKFVRMGEPYRVLEAIGTNLVIIEEIEGGKRHKALIGYGLQSRVQSVERGMLYLVEGYS